VQDVQGLAKHGQAARAAVIETPLPEDLHLAIISAYNRLCGKLKSYPEMAVRSSATAEDLPEASFAGQHETFLNVQGREGLLRAVKFAFASLFTDRAIVYRAMHGFHHLDVALSAGVMPMVRSDRGSAGVIFTLDPESGFRDVVVITSSYGGIFPKGIVVGHIVDFHSVDFGLYTQARIKLSVNMNALEEVFVKLP
jgi:pyruvate,water dikinase